MRRLVWCTSHQASWDHAILLLVAGYAKGASKDKLQRKQFEQEDRLNQGLDRKDYNLQTSDPSYCYFGFCIHPDCCTSV